MCGRQVRGDGYTNHCPACLWSKHVDHHPGDRAAACRGLMEPRGLLYERGGFVILHRCTGCGLSRSNRTAPDDDIAVLLG